MSLVSHVYPKQFRVYKGKIEALAESRIGFKDYMAFNKMLKSVEEISSAIDTFSEANSGNFGREHLIHASVAVSNVELSSEVADVLMHVFSDKGKGTLNQEVLTSTPCSSSTSFPISLLYFLLASSIFALLPSPLSPLPS